ncbi:hypothetical protein [Pararcticibacter amylolyticus]|uniref:Uncharacterized protein n=1 Tax=Pararcticibacter amylolyticus TaxID=2173175 RepID=A0A2U2PIF2_9SPHI|nr:hypothetical protein [Pararcticibacter amylolyticus]PWG81187.1 hypothetical protein DDR33_07310 [Pararcticibacter amylolyticus]
MTINTLSFWFMQHEDRDQELHLEFYGLSFLLLNLLKEKYEGKRIEFANLHFYAQSVFDQHPKLIKEEPYFFRGHLLYYGVIDYENFLPIPFKARTAFIWEKACEYLKYCGKHMKNKSLLEAVDYAYEKGKSLDYCTNSEVVTADLLLFGMTFQAAILIIFGSDVMRAKLVLKSSGKVVFEKDVDQGRRGAGLFLEIFSRIVAIGNVIHIEGPKNIEGFPKLVPISKEDLDLIK